jgi:NAD-dependent protein deacetylase/lipoamidase
MVDYSKRSAQEIHNAADIIRASKHGAVLTGAGISTDSGLPDFRSPESGLWQRYDPFEVASLDTFRYHPEKFYSWIRPLMSGIRTADPNPAHIGLARLEQMGYIQTIITQNIDGLHQQAGSTNVLEVHGSFRTLTCTNCFCQYDSANYLKPYLELGEMPYCPECHHILKPDIILFGEQLPVRTWLKAREVSKHCDVMIVAGSSLEVLPAAGLPMLAIENGAHLIIINKTQTYLNVRADVVFLGDVAEVIPRIVAEVVDD